MAEASTRGTAKLVLDQMQKRKRANKKGAATSKASGGLGDIQIILTRTVTGKGSFQLIGSVKQFEGNTRKACLIAEKLVKEVERNSTL